MLQPRIFPISGGMTHRADFRKICVRPLNGPPIRRVSTGMNFPSSLFVATAALVVTVSAAEPDHELTPDIARKLVGLMTKESSERLTVALILPGNSTGNAFESDHAKRVIVLHAVPGNGGRVRKAETYNFIWNADYGWFFWETRSENGGDVIWIWSETKGEITIR
ncbi:MAG: hypothetical protein JWO82_1875 [Akkermansiaceae bacterium]|nr:hypothetical protein [Akkermansiaceae bacterium]